MVNTYKYLNLSFGTLLHIAQGNSSPVFIEADSFPRSALQFLGVAGW
jgi:hypothetical protein